MKKVSFEQFNNRMQEVAKARRIFIESGLTNNISDAFALYQDIFAEEQMEVFVTTMASGNRPITPIDDYVRPRCPECDVDLRLIIGTTDPDGKEWPTAWYCEQCFTYFYQNKTVVELMQELKKKGDEVENEQPQ